MADRVNYWRITMGVGSGLQRCLVFVVGCTMALAGFLLSASASIVLTMMPLLRPRVPDEAFDHARRRVHFPQQDEHAEHDPSDTASADSLQSFNSATSEPASSRQAPSTPPTSLGNSPESPSQALPPASPTPHGSKSGQICTSTSRHVCTPEKCSNNAGSSGAGSSSLSSPPVAQENPEKYAKCGINEGEGGSKTKSTRAIRAVSWLKGSPLNTSSDSQRTPRSSGECSRIPSNTAPPHAVTFNEEAISSLPTKKHGPRRASTLLSFKRFSKTSSRSDTEDAPSSFSALGMTPAPSNLKVPEGRNSAPASPTPILRELPELAQTEIANRERKRRISYFSRLKRKGSGKEKEPKVVPPEEQAPVSEVKEPERGRLSTVPPPPQANSSTDRGRGRSREKQTRTSLKRKCEKRRRPTTAPTAPPPRTNPYEAPYFFPTPLSPDVADYVRLARTEVRRTSISPSAAARMPMLSSHPIHHLQNQNHPLTEIPTLPQTQTLTQTQTQTPTRSGSTKQKRSSAIVASSPSPGDLTTSQPSRPLQSVPSKRASFPAVVFDRHRKTTSVSETSPLSPLSSSPSYRQPSEFGVLQPPISPTDSRG